MKKFLPSHTQVGDCDLEGSSHNLECLESTHTTCFQYIATLEMRNLRTTCLIKASNPSNSLKKIEPSEMISDLESVSHGYPRVIEIIN